jgi:hypothetical protein
MASVRLILPPRIKLGSVVRDFNSATSPTSIYTLISSVTLYTPATYQKAFSIGVCVADLRVPLHSPLHQG